MGFCLLVCHSAFITEYFRYTCISAVQGKHLPSHAAVASGRRPWCPIGLFPHSGRLFQVPEGSYIFLRIFLRMAVLSAVSAFIRILTDADKLHTAGIPAAFTQSSHASKHRVCFVHRVDPEQDQKINFHRTVFNIPIPPAYRPSPYSFDASQIFCHQGYGLRSGELPLHFPYQLSPDPVRTAYLNISLPVVHAIQLL